MPNILVLACQSPSHIEQETEFVYWYELQDNYYVCSMQMLKPGISSVIFNDEISYDR